MKRQLSVWVSLVVLAASGLLAADEAGQGFSWPTSEVDLPWAVRVATTVVVALSTNQAAISNRTVSHISTTMNLGGETIAGGGYVTHARCRQEFRVLELLHGKKPSDNIALEYGFVEKSDAFPGPRTQSPIPVNEKVILILGETNSLLKVLPDTAQSRRRIKETHNQRSAADAGFALCLRTGRPRSRAADPGRWADLM